MCVLEVVILVEVRNNVSMQKQKAPALALAFAMDPLLESALRAQGVAGGGASSSSSSTKAAPETTTTVGQQQEPPLSSAVERKVLQFMRTQQKVGANTLIPDMNGMTVGEFCFYLWQKRDSRRKRDEKRQK